LNAYMSGFFQFRKCQLEILTDFFCCLTNCITLMADTKDLETVYTSGPL